GSDSEAIARSSRSVRLPTPKFAGESAAARASCSVLPDARQVAGPAKSLPAISGARVATPCPPRSRFHRVRLGPNRTRASATDQADHDEHRPSEGFVDTSVAASAFHGASRGSPQATDAVRTN